MKSVLFQLICLCPLFALAQTNPVVSPSPGGYEIKVQIKPYKNLSISLGHYFGQQFPIVGTAVLNEESEAVFQGPEKLPGGVYVISLPERLGSLEILLDQQQKFSISTDISAYGNAGIQVEGSPENLIFIDYQQYMQEKQGEIYKGHQQLANASNPTDSAVFIRVLSDLDREIQDYRNEIVKKDPKSLLCTLLVAMREPKLPEALKNPTNAQDSTAAKYYVKKHFWDGVNFWDGRLAYTPFFDSKLEQYFTEILEPAVDSVTVELDKMLGLAGANQIMNQFLLNRVLYNSMYHRYHWDDGVFVFLFENYIANKNYDWFLEPERKMITERAYYLMGNIIGSPAPDIELPGPDGNTRFLHDMEADYTLICFWDATCSHCIETLPKMDSIYRNEWEKAGLKVMAVASESAGKREDWTNYIAAHHVEAWNHVYNSVADEQHRAETGKVSYLQLFDVWYSPSFYLLDKEKRFMAKKLTYPQMVELLNTILKKTDADNVTVSNGLK